MTSRAGVNNVSAGMVNRLSILEARDHVGSRALLMTFPDGLNSSVSVAGEHCEAFF